ncbi:phosphate ABC transporter substrate-binding protein [Mollicutes bacterium LVI A0078]|nr:phosphate ABC transporter substrate-binding protein [Mollicutes bacterium LVI A0075]WOO90118.1 phosphate ABC transporter substrate-binding protein [Mollicutes bacterium LVI A0078]
MKKISLILGALVLVLAGCGSSGETITVNGSTSVESFFKETLAPQISNDLGYEVEYQATGSSDGIQAAQEGTADFGTSSRDLKDDEQNLDSTVMAYDGIAVVVNKNNPVTDISMEDIAKVFKGEITNWSELGGDDADIVVVSREDGSGTRTAIEELVGFENELVDGATIADGNGNVASTVAENPNAIGYVSFTTLEDNMDKLTGLKVDGAEPTPMNVKSGDYAVARPFLLVYQEQNLTDADKEVLAWIETTGVTYAPDAGLIEA